jgi:thiol-disulfide isomerase/thioredoxin
MHRLALACVLLFASPALAQVSDELLEERIDAMTARLEAAMSEGQGMLALGMEMNRAIAEALEGIEISELTPSQIALLQDNRMLISPFRMSSALDRCRESMKEDDLDGAMAALVHARLMVADRAMRYGSAQFIEKALRAYLEHPESRYTVGRAGSLWAETARLVEHSRELPEALEGVREAMETYADRALAMDNNVAVWEYAPELLDVLRAAGSPEGEVDERIEQLTERIEIALDGNLGLVFADEMRGVLDRLTRAEREEALVGSPMPEMNILWSSDESVDAFEDYRGKVLVLDFWATWCGPCIMSFPRVRALREKYSEEDVAIVGVTSVQGMHFHGMGGGRTDCTGDPDKEFALMREFMGEHDMTWDVVFTEENVFNPDFVIEGIPHVVIIDAQGDVRHRGLHPSDPEKTAMIDALLDESEPE